MKLNHLPFKKNQDLQGGNIPAASEESVKGRTSEVKVLVEKESVSVD